MKTPLLIAVLMIDTLAWIAGAVWLVSHDHPVFGAAFVIMAWFSTVTLKPRNEVSK